MTMPYVALPNVLRDAPFVFLALQYLWVCAGNPSIPMKYLDNTYYSTTEKGTRRSKGSIEFDKKFPPPPLFIPPPPSWRGDKNALLREVFFANILETITQGIKGYKDELGNDIPKPGKNKGGDFLTTDVPACIEMMTLSSPTSLDTRSGQCTADCRTLPGEPGVPGEPGLSGVSGKHGETGKRGRRGRPGRVGPPGPEGPEAFPGLPGPEGPEGSLGPQGVEGQPGPVGLTGTRGPPGYTGKPGIVGKPGKQGPKGMDGIPGLVIFHDESAMHGISLEGLMAYRLDTKRLYFRDNVSWRAIKVTSCGDGAIDKDVGEECDDGNTHADDTCVNCRNAFCGDGFIHSGVEECDGKNFNGNTCASIRRGMVGTLSCSSRCRISYRRCRFPRR